MCEWEQKISAYWDNELTTEEAEKVAEHLRTCAECQFALNSFQQIRRLLLRENLPMAPTAIATTIERLNREGAFQVTIWRRWLLQFDSWLMRPKVAFKVAMAVSLVSALILANLSSQISQAAEKIQGSVQNAIQSALSAQVWQKLVSLTGASQTRRR